MSIFVETVVGTEQVPVLALHVPNGRTWRIMAISEIALSEGQKLRLNYTDPSDQHLLFYQVFTMSAGTKSISGAIGVEFAENEESLVFPLPDIVLPTGAHIYVELLHAPDDPPASTSYVVRTGNFLIED